MEKPILSVSRVEEHSTVKVSEGSRDAKEFLSGYPRSILEHSNRPCLLHCTRSEGKFVPVRAMNAHLGREVSLHSFFTSVIDGGDGLYGPSASLLGIKPPITIKHATDRATESVRTFRKSENPSHHHHVREGLGVFRVP